jgi:hypothetical protein
MMPVHLQNVLAESTTIHAWLSSPTYLPGHADAEAWCGTWTRARSMFMLFGLLPVLRLTCIDC